MPERKFRIAKRKSDGVVLSWTKLLDNNPDWRSGWKIIKEDGTVEITLDTSEPMAVETRSQSEIEKLLIEENTKLKELLSELGWDGKIPGPKPDVVAAPPKPALEPGESPLLSDEDMALLTETGVPTELTLQAPDPVEETSLEATPQIKRIAYNDIKRMQREQLIVLAHKLEPGVNLPDGATKKELIKNGKIPGPKPDVVAAPPKPALEPGESPLLSDEDMALLTETGVPTELTLQAPDPVEETPLEATPQIKRIAYNDIKRMQREQLIVLAHKLEPGVNLPDGATKKELIKTCSELQKKVFN